MRLKKRHLWTWVLVSVLAVPVLSVGGAVAIYALKPEWIPVRWLAEHFASSLAPTGYNLKLKDFSGKITGRGFKHKRLNVAFESAELIEKTGELRIWVEKLDLSGQIDLKAAIYPEIHSLDLLELQRIRVEIRDAPAVAGKNGTRAPEHSGSGS